MSVFSSFSPPVPSAPPAPAVGAAPIPPPPADAAILRLGTLNVGLGFLRKLPRILSRFSALALDAVALQELGDPALLSTNLSPYLLVYAGGPSNHEAGVGLLLSRALAQRAHNYRRSPTGRLVAAVLELAPGQQTLLACAYMPSGLDHHALDSPQHTLAHELYHTLVGWSAGMDHVILMGDLNETLSRWDRLPLPAAPLRAVAPTPISCLGQQGFVDAYRCSHPSSQHSPGFTHSVPGARPSHSRIDYIWCKGFVASSLLRIHIDTALRALSHHRLLWLEVELSQPPPPSCSTPLLQMRLPNLRAATKDQLDAFVLRLQKDLLLELDELRVASCSDQPSKLDWLASRLTTQVRRSAFASLPITGAAAYKSSDMLQLQRRRRDLTRLLHVSSALCPRGLAHARVSMRCGPLTRSPEWTQLYRRCVEHHAICWSVDPFHGAHLYAWVSETRQLLRDTRSAMRGELRRMQRARRPLSEANPAALVHRMMKSDALPAELLSVLDPHGSLTSSAEELETVMVDHFRAVFALPEEAAAPLEPAPAMLLSKDGVEPRWYDSLLVDVKEEELLETLKDAPLVSSPGQDEVSTGLWKVALLGSAELRALVAALFCGCLRTSSFPSGWKSSVIVPLLKDEQKARSMSNVRPISLQSCLGKLFNKVLAHRLGAIFANHPILNPAQRGFILGGSITKCIDELFDAWEWSRAGKHELYTLFYDIKQAYDSVQASVLTRAMQRIRMPDAFVQLVQQSLTGLSSCVRTAYGFTTPFAVERSLRQGDPLAPLLFVILMDALHDGLERNPFTGERHGLQLHFRDGLSVGIPSLGYADDTTVLANTLEDLRVQNEWVHYFMAFNSLRLNHAKCELVGGSYDGNGLAATCRGCRSGRNRHCD